MENSSDNRSICNSSVESTNSSSSGKTLPLKESHRGKKRKRGTRKTDKRKKLKNTGKSHVNTAGEKMPRKVFQPVVEFCKEECCKKVSIEYQSQQFQSWWDIGDKEKQDIFLATLIEEVPLKSSAVSVKTKNRKHGWRFHVTISGDKIRVCKSFIITLFQITNRRITFIQSRLSQPYFDMSDNRGKHPKKKIADDVYPLASKHLSLIPHSDSHYTQSERKYFDNPNLTIKDIYTEFKRYYFDQTGKDLEMEYNTYHRWFRENSIYSIKQTRSDVCDFCTECEGKLIRNPEDPCKADYGAHKQKVADYQDTKKSIINLCKSDESVQVFEFDYGQNLPLPKLPVTSQFYRRLLWMYVFNIHCHNDGNSAFYWFLEFSCGKSPDSVASFIHDFFRKYLPSPKIKKIIVFSDSCGGQNKNHLIVMSLSWLSQKYKVIVEHIFPVRGHSYNQCDRNFGLYGRLKNRMEVIATATDYVKLLETCRENPSPFLVIEGTSIFKNWFKPLIVRAFKKPHSDTGKFKIQSYDHFLFTSNGLVEVTLSNRSNKQTFSVWKSVFDLDEILCELSAFDPVGLASAEMTDVKSLISYLKEPAHQKWFEETLNTVSTYEAKKSKTAEKNGNKSEHQLKKSLDSPAANKVMKRVTRSRKQ